MGVCCIVFDIDGMLFMNFLNIEKNKILRIFFQYFKFSSRFMLFPTLKFFFFFKKNNSFSFHVLCYFQHQKKY